MNLTKRQKEALRLLELHREFIRHKSSKEGVLFGPSSSPERFQGRTMQALERQGLCEMKINPIRFTLDE